MHRGHRVVAWVPYGREVTVSILIRYLLRDWMAGVVDEVWLYMNTGEGQEDDVKYAHELHEKYRAVIRLKPIPGVDDGWESHVETGSKDIPGDWRLGRSAPIQLNTGRAPIYMQDPSTVYVRFDDDIVWVHPDTIITLVDRVLDRREDIIGCFPTIWNNAVSSYMLQCHRRIPYTWGHVGMNTSHPHQVSAVDPVGWGDPYFAEHLHEHVLAHVEHDRGDELLLPAEMELGWRQQFSVSCFAIHGSRYAELNGVLDWDEEEHWLTMHRTGVLQRSNIVCGMAQVAHYSFYTQRAYLISNTNILDRYRQVADKLAVPDEISRPAAFKTLREGPT